MPETVEVMWALPLAAAVVIYNNAMNAWPRFHGSIYIPANLTLTTCTLGIAAFAWEIPASQLGLGQGQADNLLFGVAAGAIVSFPLFLALASPRAAAAVADERAAGLTLGQLLFRALGRVPLGTALPEEVLFRGILYAVAQPLGPMQAAVLSSVAFGLWHIAPTRNLLEENGLVPGRSRLAVATMIAGAVLATAAGGAFLVWLRVESGGIAAGLGLHATLNSLGMVAAHLANRRTSAAATRTRVDGKPDLSPLFRGGSTE